AGHIVVERLHVRVGLLADGGAPAAEMQHGGDGMVTLGTRLVTDLRNLKSSDWMGRAWRSLPVTCITGGAKFTSPALPWKLAAMPPRVSTPSSCSRKSIWK